MLSNAAARSGLAPPKLRSFDAARPSPRRSSPSPPVISAARRRAENGRKEKSTTALGDDRPGDLERPKEKARTVPGGDLLATQGAVYDALARIAVDLLLERGGEKKRVVVGLAGGPGSGKSTAAAAVVARVNSLWRERRRRCGRGKGGEEDEVAAVLPMDGYHLTRAQLAASVDPPPAEMFARRGAPWTFDADAFVETVREVVEAGSEADGDGEDGGEGGTTVLAPSFDHGVGDPVPGAVAIKPSHRFVLVEGNYLLLPRGPWSRLVGGRGEGEGEGGGGESGTLPSLFDQTWFLDVGLDDAMERVARRQAADGVPEETSRARVETNDRPNGALVASTKERADLVVRGDLPL